MKYPISLAALNSRPEFETPKILNSFGVTLEDFRDLRFNKHPALLNMFLMQIFDKPRQRAMLRRVKAKTGNDLLDEIYPQGNGRRSGIEFLQQKAEYLTRHLYTDEAGKVQSTLKATFSYADPYRNSTSDYWEEWTCPDCRTVSDGAEGEGWRFDHVSGPYHRCQQCNNVVRPAIAPGQEPADDDEWEWYQDWLDRILEEYVQPHLESLGLPPPDGLHASADGIDWRGRSGYTSCKFSGVGLARALSVNGDFFIADGEVRCPPGQIPYLECTLAHHDASPRFTIWPCWHSDGVDDGVVVGPDIFEAQARVERMRHLNPEEVYELLNEGDYADVLEAFREEVGNELGEDHPVLEMLMDDHCVTNHAWALGKLIQQSLNSDNG